MEHWEELLDLVLEWTFVPLGLSFLLLLTAGSGLWKPRLKRTVWVVGLVLMGVAAYLGVDRHEWGEVLFNGQLL